MRARENPFAVHRLHQLRFRPQVGSWPELLTHWEQLKHRGAIVGPEGRGKTTLLLELVARLRDQGWQVRLATLRRSQTKAWDELPADLFVNLSHHDCVLLDGGEQLGHWAWRRFLREVRPAGGLIVTLHRECRLPTWIYCQTSAELLDELVSELLGPIDDSIRDINRYLFEKHGGNLRLALREWYDVYAEMS